MRPRRQPACACSKSVLQQPRHLAEGVQPRRRQSAAVARHEETNDETWLEWIGDWRAAGRSPGSFIHQCGGGEPAIRWLTGFDQVLWCGGRWSSSKGMRAG